MNDIFFFACVTPIFRYGCLGFSNSRFYARPIAALVTHTGREILQDTVELTQGLGYDVIYGDTDSIMVNTGSSDWETVQKIGRQVKKEVNKKYKLLEIEIDGVYQMMLLLKKKKYAALAASKGDDGVVHVKKEMKGLDMVRRDWCPLSKEAGEQVLDFILSGEPSDQVVDKIHEYLENLARKIRSGDVPLSKFIITKGLNKAPHEFVLPSVFQHAAILHLAPQLCARPFKKFLDSFCLV